MYNKIIIIYPKEFTNKEYTKNSILEFQKKGIKVEVWIIKKILNQNDFINLKIICKKKVKIKIIKSISTLIYFLNQESYKTLFDVRINVNIKSIKFFKIFFKKKIDYILFPGLILNKSKIHYKLQVKLKNLFIKLIFIFSNIKIRNAKFVYLISKQANIYNNPLISKNSNFIKGHHADYDKYISYRFIKKNKYPKKFFLFLDQDVPNHPDLVALKLNDLNEKEYYNSLKKFFIEIEKKHGLRYLVSPHPRAKVNKIKKYFGNRVSKVDTIELIKNCEFVLCHDSTAINYAFLLKKPIIPIINNEMLNSKYDHLSKNVDFCKRANLELINIHKNRITNKIKKINKKNYKNYIENYIKYNKLIKNRADIIFSKIMLSK